MSEMPWDKEHLDGVVKLSLKDYERAMDQIKYAQEENARLLNAVRDGASILIERDLWSYGRGQGWAYKVMDSEDGKRIKEEAIRRAMDESNTAIKELEKMSFFKLFKWWLTNRK